MPRKPGRMKKLGDKTFQKTNQELADEELNVLMHTDIDWESLRPRITNQATYDKLIRAVEEATQQNRDLALLKTRLQALGKETWELARKVIAALP
jgi:hypothetical protein